MKKIFSVLCGVSVMSMIPAVAGAVGTYYNGNLYQNPQQRYSRGQYNSYYGARRGYMPGRSAYRNQSGEMNRFDNQQQPQEYAQEQSGEQAQNKKVAKQQNKKQGFLLGAGLSHEIGEWSFDMNKAGSKLHYDNLMWNVFEANGVYYFGESTPMQIKAGVRYGMQFGDSPMVDDDISTDAVWEAGVMDVDNTTEDFVAGTPAMSVGTSKDGKQMGFNVAFGLTDYFTWGKMKITPSIGYRYFKHKLTTEENYGTAISVLQSDTFDNCLENQYGEIQCNPMISFVDGDKTNGFVTKTYGTYAVDEDTGDILNGELIGNYMTKYIGLNGTYYYEQSGTSHKYETEWAGPYLALDMEYQINKDNLVAGGIEFGLPIYDSKGDQPYRWDWAHPTSVEDKGGFGDAYHLGLNAAWTTAITDSTSISLGFTFDYYKVSKATAKTYLNPSVYQERLDEVNYYLDEYDDGNITLDEDELADLEQKQADFQNWKSAGWTVEDKNEVNSIYKTMGIRIGISTRF